MTVRQRIFWKKFFALTAVVTLLFFGGSAMAQTTDTFGLNQVSQTTVLGGGDIRVIIAQIIRAVLGLLGIIALVLMLYAGYMIMTSAGDEEKVSTGRRILVNATIGLAIILSAFAITQFVFNRLQDAINPGSTGGGGNTACGTLGADPATCGGTDSFQRCVAGQFVVKSITPHRTTVAANNLAVRVIVSRGVAGGTDANQVFRIRRDGSDVTNDFTYRYVDTNRTLVEATPQAEREGNRILPRGSYEIEVSNDIRDRDGNRLQTTACGRDFARAANFTVTSDTNIDRTSPTLEPFSINGALTGGVLALPRGGTYALRTPIADDSGIGSIEIRIAQVGGSDATTVYEGPALDRGSSAPLATPYTFSYPLFLPANLATGQYSVRMTITDIDHNTSFNETQVLVVGNQCTFGTGAGADASCRGNNSCINDTQCASGVCNEARNQCEVAPVILSVDPWDGAAGSWVTVLGQYFGSQPGAVFFGNDRNTNGTIEETEWVNAPIVQCGANTSWSDTAVVVTVPTLAVGTRAPIRITRGDNNRLDDTTINERGPIVRESVGRFTINNTTRPGLCSVTVAPGQTGITAGGTSALAGTRVIARGRNFGAQQPQSLVIFGGVQSPFTAWTEETVNTAIPTNLQPGQVGVTVSVWNQTANQAVASNAVPFQVLSQDEATAPVIGSVTPLETTPGSLITVAGQRFGEAIGASTRVYLSSNLTIGTCTDADAQCQRLEVTLPAACGTETWSQTQAIARVPTTLQPGRYVVIVQNAAGRQTLGRDQLVNIIAGTPRPSICLLTPNRGPAPLAPDTPGLRLVGFNFLPTGANPTVYFWPGASRIRPDDISSWLSTTGPALTTREDGQIVTRIPERAGYSMQSGPIFIQNAANQPSNSVQYTVADCRESRSDSIPGYQCCQLGADAGRWVANTTACAGETREAGYAWRFTTGKIARLPAVIESCTETDVPSPTPSILWNDGRNVCLNAQVAVRLTTPLDEATIANNVRVYACGSGSTQTEPDCRNAQDVTAQSVPRYQGEENSSVVIVRSGPNLAPETWYRVMLLDGLRSLERIQVVGVEQIKRESILKTRACGRTPDGRDTAYCFDFKTAAAGVTCSLQSVGIQPPSYTARSLGLILDSRQAPGGASPLYFYLFGRGNQSCTVISVDNFGWQWGTVDPRGNNPRVTAANAPGGPYTDTRATVTALEQTTPDSVEVRASTSGAGNRAAVERLNLLSAALGNQPGVLSVNAPTDMRVLLDPSGANNFANFATMTIRYRLADLGDPRRMAEADWQRVGYTVQRDAQGAPIAWTAIRFLVNRGNGYTAYVVESRLANGTDRRAFMFSKFMDGPNLILSDNRQESSTTGSVPGWWNNETEYQIAAAGGDWQLVRDGARVTGVTTALIPRNDSVLPVVLGAQNSNGLNHLRGSILALRLEKSQRAAVNIGTFSPLSLVTVNLEPPRVTGHWPNCFEACVNSSVGVQFSRPMNIADYSVPGAVTLARCTDGEPCTATTPVAIEVPADEQRDTVLRVRPASGAPFEPNTFYIISVGQTVRSIGGYRLLADGVTREPILGEPIAIPFSAKFRTKADGARCIAQNIQIEPASFIASVIGEKTRYVARPFGAPDQCSTVGQELNPWTFGWQWSIPEQADATPNNEVANISRFQAAGNPTLGCTLGCIPAGSSVPSTAPREPLCGNGRVEPGEDCDIGRAGEVPGVSCDLSCLRPGNRNVGTVGTPNTCGNGRVDEPAGEECDPGDALTRVGCSAQCQRLGSERTVTGDPATPVCGSGQVTSGEDCEVGALVDGIRETTTTCSPRCVHLGTRTSRDWCDRNGTRQLGTNGGLVRDAAACRSAVSVCGNGFVESGEECEVRGSELLLFNPADPANPTAVTASSGLCSASCRLQEMCNASGIPLITSPLTCARGTAGCANDCTLAGSSISYSESSLCGDSISGLGELAWCEAAAPQNGLGGNPVQVVTAVGQGTVRQPERYQETTVNATIIRVQEGGRSVDIPQNQQVRGQGTYRLQCGYTEFQTGRTETVGNPPQNVIRYNDCPNRTDGVGTDSCCYPRPSRVASFPADGAGFPGEPGAAACTNTHIEVTFDRVLDDVTIERNVLLAKGYATNTCPTGEVDVSGLVRQTLALRRDEEVAALPGFWQRVWERVTGFFGERAEASRIRPTNILSWCMSPNTVRTSARRETVPGGTAERTVITLQLEKQLDPTTVYAVMLKGGGNGLKDARGVAIVTPGAQDAYDSVVFQTGNGICKIQSVTVAPSQWLFTAPNTERQFTATAETGEGQRITSIPGVYAWDWRWLPANDPVFAIPSQGTPNTSTISIGARGVEGKVTALAQAVITEDTGTQNNDRGRAFTGSTNLQAAFCERPWPPREFYPYEDGVPFGATGQNNDGAENGEFVGGPMPRSVIANAPQDFNFSLGYCADDGRSGVTTDDLPFLRPFVYTRNEGTGIGGTTGQAFQPYATLGSLRNGTVPDARLQGASAIALQPTRRVVAVAARGSNAVTLVDVRDALTPRVLTSIVNGTDALLERPTALAIGGNFVYVLSDNTRAGNRGSLQILEIVGNRLRARGNIVHNEGTVPNTARLQGARSIVVRGTYAYVTATTDNPATSGLQVFDISNPDRPTPVGAIANGDGGARLVGAYGLALDGNYAYVTVTGNGQDALQIINITNPGQPQAEGRTENFGGVLGITDVAIRGDYAYIIGSGRSGNQTGNPGVTAINIRDRRNPVASGVFGGAPGYRGAIDLQMVGNTVLIVSNQVSTFSRLDVNQGQFSNINFITNGNTNISPFLGGARGVVADTNVVYVVSETANALQLFAGPSGWNTQLAATETNANVVLPEETLKRFLFFNDKNDDAIGIQIFRNTSNVRSLSRLSARQWYRTHFPGSDDSKFRSITIGGYDAITDGNNYYVNALNQANRTAPVYNNIYLFSINPNAQANTRRVFDALIKSLTFNINISELGFCSDNGNTNAISTGVTATACTTDFECLTREGAPLPGTAGICANAKTKFLRDWTRLNVVREDQEKIEAYKENKGGYPTLLSGSYLPNQTNSRWPSWGTLSGLVGGLKSDPLNTWAACGRCRDRNAQGQMVGCVTAADCPGTGNACIPADAQTCWAADITSFICPRASSVTEYTATTTEYYLLRQPLEYFDPRGSIVTEFIDTNHYSATASCRPLSLTSPNGERCGDGVITPSLGEECDPPGQATLGTRGIVTTGRTAGRCAQNSFRCFVNQDCIIPAPEFSLLPSEDNGPCVGASQGSSAVANCLVSPTGASEVATAVCSSTCRITYGSCRAAGDCGNGRVESGEVCDDGVNNGQYGRCNTDCRAVSAQACGNGRVDFADTNGNNQRDQNEAALEFCDRNDPAIAGPRGFCQRDSCVTDPRQYPAEPVTNRGLVRDVAMVAATGGWIISDDVAATGARQIMSRAGTGAWTAEYIPNAGAPSPYRLFIRSQTNGWSVGDRGLILRYQATGPTRWIGEASGVTASLRGVYFVDDTTGWAVGEQGTILKRVQENTAQPRWTVQRSGVTVNLYDVYFVDDRRGWVVGENGVVLATQNGGATWETQSIGGISPALQSVWFVNAQTGFIAGNNGTLLRTVNGGTTWTRITSAQGVVNFNRLYLLDLHFINERIGWAAGYELVNIGVGRWLRTEDGGETWQAGNQTGLGTYAVDFVDENTGWIGGHMDDPAGRRGMVVNVTIDSYCSAPVATCTPRLFQTPPTFGGPASTNSNLNGTAECGGPGRRDECRYVEDSSYYPVREQSCSLDCQAPGGFCGDGVVQTGFEGCDDGNRVNTDACSNYCVARRAVSVRPTIVAASCGNGTIDAGEVCDSGDSLTNGNGVACVPTYGQSCRYCARDCQEELTVDSENYCGNGRIDFIRPGEFERCETLPDGSVLASTTPGTPGYDQTMRGRIAACTQVVPNPGVLATLRGTFTCDNTCTGISNSCIACGLKSVAVGGVIPRFAVVNPMTGPWSSISWGRNTFVTFFYPRTDFGPNETIDGRRPWGSRPLLLAEETQYTTFLELFNEGRNESPLATERRAGIPAGIETRAACTEDYKLHLGNQVPAAFTRNITPGDFFPYPVRGQGGTVDNEYIMSPALPRGSVRVVVRWGEREAGEGSPLFLGMVYALGQASTPAQPNPYRYTSTLTPPPIVTDQTTRIIMREGTVAGGVVFAPGMVNQAFQFDGIDDLVTIASSSIPRARDLITLEAWVRPENPVKQNAVIAAKNPNEGDAAAINAGRSPYMLFVSNGRFGWRVGQREVLSTITVESVAGQFVHLAGTYTTNGMTLYVNGQREGFVNPNGTQDLVETNGSFVIGNYAAGQFENDFRGLVDEVSIYRAALSEAQIRSIVTAGPAGKCVQSSLRTDCVKPFGGSSSWWGAGMRAWWGGDGNARTKEILLSESTQLCRDIARGAQNYWVADACRINNGVRMHDVASLRTVFSHAVTIEPVLQTDRPYAFVVEALANPTVDGTPRPIAAYADGEVQVEVYEYHEGQTPDSLYTPTRVFRLRDARDTSSSNNSRYWHVFNLLRDSAGNLRVQEIQDDIACDQTGQVRQNGSMETCWIDVRRNVPGDNCQRDVRPGECAI